MIRKRLIINLLGQRYKQAMWKIKRALIVEKKELEVIRKSFSRNSQKYSNDTLNNFG